MSWTDIDLAGVSTEMERLPEGNYVFGLLQGAKYNQWDPNKIEVGIKVVEGEYAGRVLYISYPDPEKMDWSPAALKRLEEALVKDGASSVEAGQDPVEYFNQPDVVGKRFVAPVNHRQYEKKDGTKETKVDVKLFKVKAAV